MITNNNTTWSCKRCTFDNPCDSFVCYSCYLLIDGSNDSFDYLQNDLLLFNHSDLLEFTFTK